MQLKDGVSLIGLKLCMRPVLIAADKIWSTLGEELVITSGTEGAHSAGSLHYYGLAIDVRVNYFTDYEKQKAFTMLCQALPEYTVLLEKDHIHIEADTCKFFNSY